MGTEATTGLHMWILPVHFSGLEWKSVCLLIMKVESKPAHIQSLNAQQTGVWGLKAEERGNTR